MAFSHHAPVGDPDQGGLRNGGPFGSRWLLRPAR